jgi:hypothetical protein
MMAFLRRLLIPVAFFLAGFSACGAPRVVTTSEVHQEKPARIGDEAAFTQEGVTVTKEVPSSKETIGEIREEEIKEPPAPQEDRVIPFHRIPRGDNNLPAPESAPDNSVK